MHGRVVDKVRKEVGDKGSEYPINKTRSWPINETRKGVIDKA